jgi:tetratricopeptide (TPR) repeat protein
MTKRIALFLLLAMMAVCTVSAVAQATVVQGTCKDESGKLIIGATVELNNIENGSKVTVKTDSRGRYSTGAPAGTYKINLKAADGTLLFYVNNAILRSGGDNTIDLDISKAAKNSGMTEAQRKQMEKAKKDSETIKGLNALLAQAAVQKKDGKFDEAVATLEQALAQDKTHDIIYGSLGDAYLLDKKFPEAEATFTKAIELAPPTSKSVGTYHNGLAQALLKQGKTAPAMVEYDKAAELDPANRGMYYFNEGAVLTNQGKADEANQAFDKAIAADPTPPEPYYQKGINLLSKATLKDGKMVPAPGTVEALNKYLELAPDGKYAQPAKDLLASMGATVQTSFGSKKGSKK